MNVNISSKNNQILVQIITALQNEYNILKEQFDWLKKQVFGRKTEQTSVIMDGGTQLSLFPDEKDQAVSVPEKTITVPEYQRKAKRTHDEWMSDLALPKGKSAYSTSVAAKAVSFCDRIYNEERQLANLTATERYEQRLVKVKPLLDALLMA